MSPVTAPPLHLWKRLVCFTVGAPTPVCVCVFRGTIDDCELVEGLVLNQRVANSGVSRVEKAKIGLIQFCLSPPKTDVSPKCVPLHLGAC